MARCQSRQKVLKMYEDRMSLMIWTGRCSRTMAALLLAVATASATAQISLSTAVDLAWQSNPKVRSAKASVDGARAGLQATRDAYIPSAGATGGYGTSTGVPLSVPVIFSLAANSLVFNFSQRDNLRAAEAGLSAANLSLKEARDQVAEDVVVTYLQLNNAQQREKVMTDEAGDANRLVQIVQDRIDAGQDTRIELLRTRRTGKQIELAQLQLQDQIASLEDHLSRLIGLPGNSFQTVASSIPPLPPVKSLQAVATEAEVNDSYAVQSAFANARSKQEIAFGEARYRFRPQISLGLNYSRISTSHTDYTEYSPGFLFKSDDAASIGIGIQVPIFDRAHEARAKQAAADAAHAYYDALDARNLFREGRFKLQQGAAELEAKSEIAEIDRDLAEEDLKTIEIQLASTGPVDPDKPQLTPKDEENARVQERSKMLDLLDAQFQLSQAQVNLMRETGQLDAWLQQIGSDANQSRDKLLGTSKPRE
jgi:outer membrane protein TolC